VDAVVWKGPAHVRREDLHALSVLTSDPENLRVHNDVNLDRIARSLVRYGQQTPVVFDANRVVRKGNGTCEALARAGWTHVWAVQTDLDGDEADAYAIADNKTQESSWWDGAALDARMRMFQDDGWDLADLGFTDEEVSAFLALTETDEEGKAAGEAAPVQFHVVIDCRDEGHQAELLVKLGADGLVCRPLPGRKPRAPGVRD